MRTCAPPFLASCWTVGWRAVRRSPQRRRPLTPRSGVMRKKKSRWPFSAVAWRQLRGLCTAVRHLPHAAGHSASVARWPGNYSVAFSRGPAAAGFWSRASQCLSRRRGRSRAVPRMPLKLFLSLFSMLRDGSALCEYGARYHRARRRQGARGWCCASGKQRAGVGNGRDEPRRHHKKKGM